MTDSFRAAKLKRKKRQKWWSHHNRVSLFLLFEARFHAGSFGGGPVICGEGDARTVSFGTQDAAAIKAITAAFIVDKL
jgi:hypothetical protein